MTIENPLAESLQDQRVALYMPVEQTNTQRLVGLEVSAPHRVLHDPVGNTILEITFYHNWAEVYVDGAWRLLDAQKQRLRTGAGEYVAMRVVSSDGSAAMGENHRFAVHGRVLARME